MRTIETWGIQLADSHEHYSQIILRRELPDNPSYTVVIVNVAKFMACVRRNRNKGFQIKDLREWDEEFIKLMREKLDHRNVVKPFMARASITEFTIKQWFGLKPPIVTAEVGFANGRHRSAYIEFAGATLMPIEVHLDKVHLFKKYCT